MKIWLMIKTSVKVTVLLTLIICPGPMRADNVNGIGMRLFEFTSEFYLPMGRGRFNGLMAYDSSCYRIAIYWMEPAVYHDNTFFLGYSDFIFSGDVVHYWINGVSKPGRFELSGNSTDPLLPRDVSVELVARSALAIVGRIMSKSYNVDIPLEVGKFFLQSRDQSEYLYEASSGQTSNWLTSDSNASDEEILNDLPFGRKYSKQARSDGTLVWYAQRIIDDPHVARVTVKPFSDIEADDLNSMFDTETLGQWSLILETYRVYWSFEQDYSRLKDLADSDVASRELYDQIESFLENNEIPAGVFLFLNQLYFKTAILTDDINRVSRSAKAVVDRLCEDESVSDYQGLLELARISEQIHQQYPQQANELVQPLVQQMVEQANHDMKRNLERLTTTIQRNNWFWYGKLLVKEARNQALVGGDVADALSARLEASRIARDQDVSDSFELTATVKQYLAKLDSTPPAGIITLDDVRQILEKGLEKPYADANLELKHELVENIIHSIRMIAGQGPFRGDRAKLTESVERFSGRYLVVFKYKEPIGTVLATFLALSFCDISTPDDHDVLFSQINKLCSEFQTLTNSMLSERGLGTLVEPNDVERIFDRYERRFRRHIDDPLWPAFKFPLTDYEETRLRNNLKMSFIRLDSFFKEMSLKVKYGGKDKKLKDKTIYNISLAAQQLLPQTAFLRNPPYPGISSQYQSRYGFAAVIKGPLYIEGERPREKFKAMKYFHMGHRLEDIVKRERELSGFK